MREVPASECTRGWARYASMAVGNATGGVACTCLCMSEVPLHTDIALLLISPFRPLTCTTVTSSKLPFSLYLAPNMSLLYRTSDHPSAEPQQGLSFATYFSPTRSLLHHRVGHCCGTTGSHSCSRPTLIFVTSRLIATDCRSR